MAPSSTKNGQELGGNKATTSTIWRKNIGNQNPKFVYNMSDIFQEHDLQAFRACYNRMGQEYVGDETEGKFLFSFFYMRKQPVRY